MRRRSFLAGSTGALDDAACAIYRDGQRVAFDGVAFTPLGRTGSGLAAMRAGLRDRLNGFALFCRPQRA